MRGEVDLQLPALGATRDELGFRENFTALLLLECYSIKTSQAND
jgi:hypothetical protein